MPKDRERGSCNIVLLSDGTGNGSASLFKTNVRRLYEALDLADPQDPAHPRQFAFYDDGVGTSTFRPLALLGGAFGYGLARNVREIYAFLCRTYRPGDRIYGFGFSRGAFTIRTIIGLIVNQGIIKYDGNEAELERKVRAAYREYRRERHTRLRLLTLLRPLRDLGIRGWYRLRRITPEMDYSKSGNLHPSRIEFVGVWDTVDAYGLPIEELTRAIDRFILPLNMADANLNRRVRRARHALALDEQRQTFHPRLWNEEATPDDEEDEDRIRQVWFAGVHSDVGGGYPDDGLAHVTLSWMISEIKAADGSPLALRLRPGAETQIHSRADENAPLHDSRRGLASYYRYRPRDIEILRNQEPNRSSPYTVKIGTPIIHQSALRRIRMGQDGYAPISSTLDFRVAMVGGGYQPAATETDSRKTSSQEDFAASRQGVFNFVWWRRVAYFLALAITPMIAAFPAHLDADRCSGWACFLSPLIQGIGGFLPGILSGWTATAAANPATLLLLLGLLAAIYAAGSRLDRRIPDEMRKVWYSFTSLSPQPPPDTSFPQPKEPGAVNTTVQRLRTDGRYIRFWNFARRTALPVLALFTTIYLAYALLSVGVMSARESWGCVCRADLRFFTENLPVSSDFVTGDLCATTRAHLRKGGRYEIEVAIPATYAWFDGGEAPLGLPASPNGLINGPSVRIGSRVTMTLLAPFRRHWRQPWFKLMARVGEQGADVYAPDWRLVSSDQVHVYRAKITANGTGPLFLYVNDGVPLGLTGWIYGNNHGTARITVRQISMEHHDVPAR